MGAASSTISEDSLRNIRDEYEENLRHKHEGGDVNDEEVLLHLRNFIMEKEGAAVKQLTNDFFNDHRDNNTICLGDIVKVRDDGLYFEAVVLSIDLENKTCIVSFGESHQEKSGKFLVTSLTTRENDDDANILIPASISVSFFQQYMFFNSHLPSLYT